MDRITAKMSGADADKMLKAEMSGRQPDAALSLAHNARERAKARREKIATAVMAGFAVTGCRDKAAADAVSWADALIAELDKEDTK